MEDSRIVDLYLARDETAIVKSSEKYGVRLLAIAKNILEDDETSRECENDTYFQAWNLIPPNEPRRYLFAFLARIIRHISLDRCRERNRKKRCASYVELSEEMEQCIPAPGDVEKQIESRELARVISRFLWKLPEVQRDVFVRRYWYLDPVRVIADQMNFSESKVKTMLFRTREKLRTYLEQEGCM